MKIRDSLVRDGEDAERGMGRVTRRKREERTSGGR